MSNFYNEYPYTDIHELNLDWILKKMRELEELVANIKEDILAEANAYTDAKVEEKIAEIAGVPVVEF